MLEGFSRRCGPAPHWHPLESMGAAADRLSLSMWERLSMSQLRRHATMPSH
jgi:hypothetical protein